MSWRLIPLVSNFQLAADSISDSQTNHPRTQLSTLNDILLWRICHRVLRLRKWSRILFPGPFQDAVLRIPAVFCKRDSPGPCLLALISTGYAPAISMTSFIIVSFRSSSLPEMRWNRFMHFPTLLAECKEVNPNRWVQDALSVTGPELPLGCFLPPHFMLDPQ